MRRTDPTASPIRTTTSSSTTTGKSKRGFTLVEILIVLSIMGMVLALGIPAVNSIISQRLNSTTRRFVGTLRTVRNDSVLLSTIHRLVVDLDEQKWWIEGQANFKLIQNPKEEEQREEDEQSQNAGFSPVKKYGAEPQELPGGVALGAVYNERFGLQSEGRAYVHFFPNGYAEPSLVYLTRSSSKENGLVLDMSPTGRIEVYAETLETLEREFNR